MKQVTMFFDEAQLVEVDEVLGQLRAAAPGARITRSDAIRHLVELGLKERKRLAVLAARRDMYAKKQRRLARRGDGSGDSAGKQEG